MIKRQLPLILVVDDEAHIVHVLSLKLRNAGYEVITAEDGQQALATAREYRPDLVITDYQMPIMTGLDLALAMKKHEPISQVPLIMLTARGFSLSHDQVDQTNITTVLSKPFSPREVLSKVEQQLTAAAEGSVEEVPPRTLAPPGQSEIA